MFYKEFDIQEKTTGKFNQENENTSEEGVEEHEELSTFGKKRDSSEEGVEGHNELSTFGRKQEKEEQKVVPSD